MYISFLITAYCADYIILFKMPFASEKNPMVLVSRLEQALGMRVSAHPRALERERAGRSESTED